MFFAINNNKASEYVDSVFYSYWTSNLDISSDEVLISVIRSLGWNAEDFLTFINLETSKELLKSNTKELAKRGGFGSPTIFIDEKNMFFGNDRLDLINDISLLINK